MDNSSVMKAILPWTLLDGAGTVLLMVGLLVVAPATPLLPLPTELAWGLVMLGGMMVLFALIKIVQLVLTALR